MTLSFRILDWDKIYFAVILAVLIWNLSFISICLFGVRSFTSLFCNLRVAYTSHTAKPPGLLSFGVTLQKTSCNVFSKCKGSSIGIVIVYMGKYSISQHHTSVIFEEWCQCTKVSSCFMRQMFCGWGLVCISTALTTRCFPCKEGNEEKASHILGEKEYN